MLYVKSRIYGETRRSTTSHLHHISHYVYVCWPEPSGSIPTASKGITFDINIKDSVLVWQQAPIIFKTSQPWLMPDSEWREEEEEGKKGLFPRVAKWINILKPRESENVSEFFPRIKSTFSVQPIGKEVYSLESKEVNPGRPGETQFPMAGF